MDLDNGTGGGIYSWEGKPGNIVLTGSKEETGRWEYTAATSELKNVSRVMAHSHYGSTTALGRQESSPLWVWGASFACVAFSMRSDFTHWHCPYVFPFLLSRNAGFTSHFL